MKYVIFFVLACVALAAAAPQFLTYPGYFGGLGFPYNTFGSRTLVTGPTVYNGGLAYTGRYLAPGYVGPAIV